MRYSAVGQTDAPTIGAPVALLFAALIPLSLAPAGAATYGGSSDIYDLVRLDDVLLFHVANPLTGHAVWRTDGTVEGTESTGLGTPGCIVTSLFPVAATGEDAFYVVQCESDYQLFVTDGSSAGTRQLTFVEPPRRVSTFYRHQIWAPSLGLLFFEVTREGENRLELWVSDGTPDGTGAIADLPASGRGELIGLVALPGKVLFQVADQSVPLGSVDLWTSDGTPSGTRELGSLGTLFQRVGGLAAVGDRVVWSVLEPGALKLYATGDDVLPAAPFLEIADPERRSSTIAPELHDGRLYFNAVDGDHDQELWRTDGTAAGTVRLTNTDVPYALQVTSGSSAPTTSS